MQVYKFKAKLENIFTISIPKDSKILYFFCYKNIITLWIMTDRVKDCVDTKIFLDKMNSETEIYSFPIKKKICSVDGVNLFEIGY